MNMKEPDKKEMRATSDKKTLIYCDDRISLVDELDGLDTQIIIRTNGYAAVLCTQGSALMDIDGKLHQIRANDLLIYRPNILIGKRVVSPDLQCCVIAMSLKYVQQINIIGGKVWDMKVFFDQNPVINLLPEEATIFCQYYDLLVSKLTGRRTKYHKELMDALLKAFAYEFREALERVVVTKPYTYTSGQNIFKEFLELLSTTYPKRRAVSYYSDCLCITPKYLSAICKEVSGQTASGLINQYVVKDIVCLLRQPDKSIKNIAFELDFPNLSFFGKYVKKHLGMSPKHYRQKCK